MLYRERIFSKLKPSGDMLVLGIESSCDETSASVVRNGREVLSLVISSQIEIHRRFGGVVPEVASRNHTLAVNSVVKQALSEAGIRLSDLSAVGVTYGAGLSGALLVGVSAAKALCFAADIPLVKVNHIRGHIAANYIGTDLEPPFLCLVVSGGHTAILKVEDHFRHTLVGTTVDDAAGEAFDKVARVLKLPYPGGPLVDKLAREGNPCIEFPKMFKGEKNYHFSYSGLKTAVINYLHTAEQRGEKIRAEDVCASFQHAAIDVLVEKTYRASEEFGLDKIAVAGGVSANGYLRERMFELESQGKQIYIPKPVLCTDNGAMIASEAYFQFSAGESLAGMELNAQPSLRL